ncbi:MAG: hypothetical protein F6K02_30485 [Moorea sp. SIO3A5]|nr:hypothetical protein [Moorena sp. SIO3A5]
MYYNIIQVLKHVYSRLSTDHIYHSNEVHKIFSLFPAPYSLLPAPDSLGALSVGELNSPRVAPLPTPDSLISIKSPDRLD